MTNKLFYVLVFVLFTTVTKAGAYQLKYRIECAKSTDKNLLVVINKIPELRKFMLPTGGQILFSGDYFNSFPEAKIRLNHVISLGFKNAFIRVFKYRRMLSRQAGDKYIEKVEELLLKDVVVSNDSTVTKEVNFVAAKKERKVVGRKTYTKKEIEELRARRKKKEEVKKKVEKVVVKKKTEEKEVVKKEEEVIEDESIVDEAPIFKIKLAKTKRDQATPSQVQELNDEVVYSYNEGKSKVYAVGFYETAEAANKKLNYYQKYSAKKPEIIGLYKGRIVSLKLAKELHAEFLKYSKSKK